MTRRLSLILATAAAAVLVLAPSGVHADAPPVFTGPDTTWSTSGTIADPHAEAACASDPTAPTPLIEAVCPTFQIVLDGADAHPLRYLDVRLETTALAPGRSIEDYDLYLYDANGTEIDLSANPAGRNVEHIARSHIPDGNYTVVVVPFMNVPDSSYTLTVRYRTAAA
jgi:hypothetical protein